MSRIPSDWTARFRAFVVAACLGFGGLVFGSLLVLAVLVVLLLGGVVTYPPSAAVQILLSTIFVQGIAFGTVAYAYSRYRDAGGRFTTFTVPTIGQLGLVVVGWAGAFAASIGVAIVFQETNAPTAKNVVENLGVAHPEVLLLLIPLAFLLVGPGEELLFRGVVQGRLREQFGPVSAILLASLIFASAHFTSLSGSLSGRVVTISALFVISLILGALYEYTQTLTVPALVHGAYDASKFAILYVYLTHGGQVSILAALH